MKPVNVELHIEELVLRGFAPGDRRLIGEAVERELARLFGDQGVPPSLPQDATVRHLDAGAFDVRPGFGTEAIGAQVARAVHGELSA